MSIIKETGAEKKHSGTVRIKIMDAGLIFTLASYPQTAHKDRKKWPALILLFFIEILAEIFGPYVLLGAIITILMIPIIIFVLICLVVFLFALGPFFILRNVIGLSTELSVILLGMFHAGWIIAAAIFLVRWAKRGKAKEMKKKILVRMILQERIRNEEKLYSELEGWFEPWVHIEEEKYEPSDVEGFKASWDYFDNENRIRASYHSERSAPGMARPVPETPDEYYAKRWRDTG